MNPTIAELIQNAIQASSEKQEWIKKCDDLGWRKGGSILAPWQESEQLANNALNERLQELIEAKLNQMMKRV